MKFHTGFGGERRIVSADRRCVRVWDAATGAAFTTVEPESDINDACLWPGSGLMVLATEAKRLQNYFVPSLGPAPRWCSFLENLTEELEEQEARQALEPLRPLCFCTRSLGSPRAPLPACAC